jgi:transposase
MIKVAIRSPGDKPWTRKTEVLEYRTFYGVLQHMAIELVRRGVTHVVMEASGVYTEPVYYALCEQDFTQIAVINPAHAKALKGHKTDAKDCARLAELFECGLLRGSYIPAPELKEVRDLTRYRALCRCRHSILYAESRIMPMTGRVAWLPAVAGAEARHNPGVVR